MPETADELKKTFICSSQKLERPTNNVAILHPQKLVIYAVHRVLGAFPDQGKGFPPIIAGLLLWRLEYRHVGKVGMELREYLANFVDYLDEVGGCE